MYIKNTSDNGQFMRTVHAFLLSLHIASAFTLKPAA